MQEVLTPLVPSVTPPVPTMWEGGGGGRGTAEEGSDHEEEGSNCEEEGGTDHEEEGSNPEGEGAKHEEEGTNHEEEGSNHDHEEGSNHEQEEGSNHEQEEGSNHEQEEGSNQRTAQTLSTLDETSPCTSCTPSCTPPRTPPCTPPCTPPHTLEETAASIMLRVELRGVSGAADLEVSIPPYPPNPTPPLPPPLPTPYTPPTHRLPPPTLPLPPRPSQALVDAFECANVSTRETLELLLPVERYRRLIGAAQLNAFELTTERGLVVSCLLGGAASYFNHHCQSNVLVRSRPHTSPPLTPSPSPTPNPGLT